jgi:AraC-like DNA-binding protein
MDRSFFGAPAKEEWHFFFFDKNTNLPIAIENIGITHPNPHYIVERKNSDYFIMEYVISGKGYLNVDGKKHTLEAGDVYCLEPGHDHAYYADAKKPFQKIWINFFSSFFVEVFKSFQLSGKTVFHKCENCYPYFQELRLLTGFSNYSDKICYRALPILLQILCELAEKSRADNADISQTAIELKRYLDDALYSTITIDELSEKVYISKSQINREFAKYFDDTPINYLLNRKIDMAKKLLKTSLHIKEVSDKLAFSNPHYFSRIFKQKTGMSPMDYKAH